MFVICGTRKVYNKDNKSPGEDRLTAEFHKHFFDLVGTDLIKSLNQSFEDGELFVSEGALLICYLKKTLTY